MGRHSNLVPTDPQIGGVPCHGVLEEFQSAAKQIEEFPSTAVLWVAIIQTYHPTFLGLCEQAIQWTNHMTKQWLESNMCAEHPEKIVAILDKFGEARAQFNHARHIPRSECIDAGLNILKLEEDPALQEAVLSTHHAFMHTFDHTDAVKIIENQFGRAYIESAIRIPS